MKEPCENCKYADISKETRTIEVNGMTITQNGGGIKCTHEHIRSISFTNGEMKCSEYQERKDEQ